MKKFTAHFDGGWEMPLWGASLESVLGQVGESVRSGGFIISPNDGQPMAFLATRLIWVKENIG